MTIHLSFHPQPPLSVYVKNIWYYQGIHLSHTKERRLPDGSVTLVINLHENLTRIYDRRNPDRFQDYRGSVLSGTHSTFMHIDTRCLISTIGVEFKPAGIFPFLPLPVSELQNLVVPLETIWGQETFALRERLIEARIPQCQFSLLEQFLLSKLIEGRDVHPAVVLAMQAIPRITREQALSALTNQIGISQRRFLQVFREAVGLTPKQFVRVLRFQEALNQLEQGAYKHLSHLAIDCGYYDQAHFIHEFQAFAGITPSFYLTQHGKYRNHVALPD